MKAREPKKARGHVKWNEENLNDIESNKPEREKITEPKTPYHPMLDEDEGPVSPLHLSESSVDKSAHADAIKTALAEAVSSGKIFDRNSWDMCDSEEAIKQGKGYQFDIFDYILLCISKLKLEYS
uniref:Phosphoprotein phosphatase inhibitors n=1 Tax=Zea mays TaxID=4577 RepID=A0A804LC63_MAIZE